MFHSHFGFVRLTASLLLTVACGISAFASEPTFLVSDSTQSLFEHRLAQLESKLATMDAKSYGDVCDSAPSTYMGVATMIAKPHLKESFEATITNLGAGTLQLQPLDNDYLATPRVWFGATNGNGLGIRASYWQYDHNGNPMTLISDGVNLPGATVTTVIYPAAIIAPAPGDVLTTANGLEMHVVDLEGTVDFTLGSLEGRLGLGLRYGRIDQVMSARATRGAATLGSLDWTRETEGFGPILSADARHCLLGDLSAIGRARAALLFGEKSLQRTVVGDVAGAAPPIVQLNNSDEVTAGFELGFGVEWKRQMASGREIFVQAMYEGQLWTESGAPTLTFLGLEGLSVSTGLRW